MTTPVPGLQVDANKVINVLKARLLDEIAKSAMLEAALQDSQEREARLAEALTGQQRQVQEAHEQLGLPQEKKEAV